MERVVEELARRMRYLEALKGLAEALLLLVVAALFLPRVLGSSLAGFIYRGEGAPGVAALAR
jgi:hypothetical protein